MISMDFINVYPKIMDDTPYHGRNVSVLSIPRGISQSIERLLHLLYIIKVTH